MFVAVLLAPAIASATSLRRIDSATAISGDEQNRGALDWVLEQFGVNLIGPGGGINYFDSSSISASATASGLNTASAWPWDWWRYGSTQTARQNVFWAGVYQLDGNPGEMASIDFHYVYKNTNYNMVFDGRSESKSWFNFAYAIVPNGVYTPDASNLWSGYYSTLAGQLLNVPSVFDYTTQPLSWDKNYHFAAITSDRDTMEDTVRLGNIGVGSQLFLIGNLIAETQAQVYGPATTIATMTSTLSADWSVQDIPIQPGAVPEPSTLLVIPFVLIGIVLARKKRTR